MPGRTHAAANDWRPYAAPRGSDQRLIVMRPIRVRGTGWC